MSDMLNKNYGTLKYDNLVNRAGDVGSIQIAAGQGILERGSVIDDEGKLLSADGTASYILCDETTTDDTDTVTGIVYKNGNFVRNSLIVDKDYELAQKDIDALRKIGIIVETAK